MVEIVRRRMTRVDVRRFSNYLQVNGAAIMTPDADNCVLRYAFPGSKPISLYLSGPGMHRGDDGVLAHISQWEEGAVTRIKEDMPHRSSLTATRIIALMERDGCDCFVCGLPLGNDITLEHLIPSSVGGPDSLGNMALAHLACNRALGDLPVAHKLEIVMATRAEFAVRKEMVA